MKSFVIKIIRKLLLRCPECGGYVADYSTRKSYCENCGRISG